MEEIKEDYEENFYKMEELRKRRITYIIKSGDYYKIGMTSDWSKRAESYNTHNPNWELIETIEGDYEHQLHHIFRDYRIKFEWFKFPTNWKEILALSNYKTYKEHTMNTKHIVDPKYNVLYNMTLEEVKEFFRSINIIDK